MKYRVLTFLFVPAYACMILSACASSRSGTPASVAPTQKAAASGVALIGGAGVANGASLEGTQEAQFPVKPEEKKKLLSDLKKTFLAEEKALQREDRSGTKAFTAAQSSKLKSWHEQEKQARRAFFEKHQSGPERRQYVQDYLKRKTDFDQAQKEELAAAKKASKEKAEHLKENQRLRELQFKAQLDQNIRPDSNLWKSN